METLDLREQFDYMQRKAKVNPYLPIQLRIEQLKIIRQLLQTETDLLTNAVSKDFKWRSPWETKFLEIFPAIKAINYCIKNLKKWSRPRRRPVSWLFFPSKAHLLPQPLGVVGNMVPWNYPIYLAILPSIYAIAAGNRVMVKMSELSPNTGRCLADLMTQYTSTTTPEIRIFNGDIEQSKIFASLPFGHLFFTGSTSVGRLVMQAASQNLSPVTLELGGKSPAIVSKTVQLSYLNRLLMGKCYNSGQTCIAPDYILVNSALKEALVKQLMEFCPKYYPEGASDDNYTSIISEEHFNRLQQLLDDAKSKGGEIKQMQGLNLEKRKMPLTLVLNANLEMKLMQDEIFGPILPVIEYNTFSEALDIINRFENPLALYYFGDSNTEISRLKGETLSGSLVINDTVTHVAVDDLPFGGVGGSGFGRYHGQEGFDRFSNLKAIFKQRRIAPVTWFYPPYGTIVKLLLRYVAGIQEKTK